MASPRTASARPLAASERRYRRSSFNGARQLSAAQAPTRRILVLLGLLSVALLVAVAVIVGTHFASSEAPAASPAGSAAATHPANY